MNALSILGNNLDNLLALPDPEAAENLNTYMAALKRVEEIFAVSYGQRLVIIRHFEERSLWRYLTDPDVGLPFPSLTAWLSSGFIGCRRTNMEAHKDALALADIPSEKLIDIPKQTLHVLKQMSTADRNDPEILESAKSLDTDEFLEKIEREKPLQHIEMRKPMKFNFGRSQAKTVEKWIETALESDIAGTREEALERACQIAQYEIEEDAMASQWG